MTRGGFGRASARASTSFHVPGARPASATITGAFRTSQEKHTTIEAWTVVAKKSAARRPRSPLPWRERATAEGDSAAGLRWYVGDPAATPPNVELPGMWLRQEFLDSRGALRKGIGAARPRQHGSSSSACLQETSSIDHRSLSKQTDTRVTNNPRVPWMVPPWGCLVVHECILSLINFSGRSGLWLRPAVVQRSGASLPENGPFGETAAEPLEGGHAKPIHCRTQTANLSFCPQIVMCLFKTL
jgi:hypothetical protein